MFGHVEHPYVLQLAALWLSFLPGFAIAALIAAARRERRAQPRR